MIAHYPSTPTSVAEPRENQEDPFDDAVYKAEFIAAVKAGIASIERGDFITLEELEKEFHSWTFDE